jgi:membrane-bound serine protease (ClpP class)
MDWITTFYQLLFNPNVAYLLLIMGLWALLGALTTPGTGVPEFVAAVCLTLAAIGLLQLPTSLAGVGLIVLAVALVAAEVHFASHGLLALGALASLLFGSLFLFRGAAGELPGGGLSPWVVGGTLVVSAAYFASVVYIALRTRNLPLQMGPQRLIGRRGIVKSRIDPLGTVLVDEELWSARAEEPIEPGATVTVVALDGLTLQVRRAGSAGAEEG